MILHLYHLCTYSTPSTLPLYLRVFNKQCLGSWNTLETNTLWSRLFVLEHKTFGLAINRDYFRTVFTSDHPCPEYIVYSQYTGGLWRNQHQKQKMARPINREGTYFMLYVASHLFRLKITKSCVFMVFHSSLLPFQIQLYLIFCARGHSCLQAGVDCWVSEEWRPGDESTRVANRTHPHPSQGQRQISSQIIVLNCAPIKTEVRFFATGGCVKFVLAE